MKTDNSGFTVVELMIVVAIIGLLAGIASYNVMGGFSIKRYRVKSAAVDLVSEIRKAKNLAIRERRDDVAIGLVFDQVNNIYKAPERIVFDEDKNESVVITRSIPLNTVRYSRGTSTPPGAAVGFTGNKLSFCSRGLASSDGFVYLSDPGGKYIFRVGTNSRAGVFMLQEWRDGQWN